MLSLGLNPVYRAMLATTYDYYVRLEVWRGSARVDAFGSLGAPKNGGSLSATLQNQVARTLNISLDGSLAAADIEDPGYLFSPLNKKIHAYAVYGGGLFEAPIFKGRIQRYSYSSSSSVVSLSCSDRAQDVIDDKFGAPRNSTPGLPLKNQYYNLITETFPDAIFADIGTFYATMPKLNWQNDRGAACNDVADAGNAYWYALADGSFTLQQVPWTVKKDPVATLINGVGGVLIDYQVDADRQDTFNRVNVVGENAGSGDAVYALAEDLDPTSPTYVAGDFGRRMALVQIQSASVQSMALASAKQYLEASRSFKQTWSGSCPPDASLELGDALLLQDRTGRQSVQVLANFTMPITGTGSMSLDFRAQIPGSLADAGN